MHTLSEDGAQIRRVALCFVLHLFLIGVASCHKMEAQPESREIVGQWHVMDRGGISVPHSLFWLSFDVLEFRENGEVWGLMFNPPAGEEKLYINASAQYRLIEPNRLEIEGSCRHEPVCVGAFQLEWSADGVLLFDKLGEMHLIPAGEPSSEKPPVVPGPMATTTT